ncbi:hypothetical protein KBK19_16040 [Microvirga sp. STR05]|uniref:YdhG-like domain-containing protein n=1 Tax=Hymenobacter duratus TaxID=2771356 RepID=A0ABR8JI84_9BACT|nr:DUF1801 domain-containing protein [Hymenobacter duratus]MBD2716554.1 hypothetical protein [Hymenobacter duratus]MBR7951469.1 hypothetical protein [Microvirga sp. STR05]
MVPADRHATVETIWNAVRKAMPAGYTELIETRMLQFVAGKEMAVALASKKNYLSLYLQTLYYFPELGATLKTVAPKLKIGKSCINFNHAEELPLSALQELLQRVPADEFQARVEAVRRNPAAAHQ